MQKPDLNLLKILCILVESGSVSYTSQHLNTSASSVSYALNKLRENFHDPLMVRVKNGMQPTLLCLDLYNKIKPTLVLLEEQLQGGFGIKSNDKNLYKINSRTMLDSWLTTSCLRDNKLNDVNLVFCNTFVGNNERLEALRRHQVDIDIGNYLPVDNAIRQYMFTLSGFDVVCQSKHERLSGEVSLDALKNEMVVGYSYEDIEKLNVTKLINMSYSGNIKMSSFGNVLAVVANSEYITLTPKSLTGYFCKLYNLQKVETSAFDNVTINFYFNILKSLINDPFARDIFRFLRMITTRTS